MKASMDNVLRQCLVSVSAVVVAILLGMLLILLMGKNPAGIPSSKMIEIQQFKAFEDMFRKAFFA